MSSPHDILLINKPENFQAGNIAFALSKWEKLTKDQVVLAMVRGVSIPLQGQVSQGRVPHPYRLSEVERGIMDQELTKLLHKGVIEESPWEKDQFVSNVFLRPKANGEFRIILDLTELNKLVVYQHFKMTSLQTAVEALREGAWMGSVDQKDAYFSVPVAREDRKYLKFCLGWDPVPICWASQWAGVRPKVLYKADETYLCQHGR